MKATTKGEQQKLLVDPPADSEDEAPAQEMEPAVDEQEGAPSETDAKSPWLPMDCANTSGKTIWLKRPDGVTVAAFWHATRKFDYKTIRWSKSGFWAIRNSGQQPIGFDPVAWMPML